MYVNLFSINHSNFKVLYIRYLYQNITQIQTLVELIDKVWSMSPIVCHTKARGQLL